MMVIVLDLYKNGEGSHRKSSPQVIETAALIGVSPASVVFRVSNYQARDPQYLATGKRGLFGGGTFVDEVWKEYAGRDALLKSDAEAARKRLASSSTV
jgi:putative restriction endonuclease